MTDLNLFDGERMKIQRPPISPEYDLYLVDDLSQLVYRLRRVYKLCTGFL
jgi:hypothetical protein